MAAFSSVDEIYFRDLNGQPPLLEWHISSLFSPIYEEAYIVICISEEACPALIPCEKSK